MDSDSFFGGMAGGFVLIAFFCFLAIAVDDTDKEEEDVRTRLTILETKMERCRK